MRPLPHVDADHQPRVLEGLEDFREHLGGGLTLTMLWDIGAGVEVDEIVPPRVLDGLAELRRCHERTERKVLRLTQALKC